MGKGTSKERAPGRVRGAIRPAAPGGPTPGAASAPAASSVEEAADLLGKVFRPSKRSVGEKVAVKLWQNSFIRAVGILGIGYVIYALIGLLGFSAWWVLAITVVLAVREGAKGWKWGWDAFVKTILGTILGLSIAENFGAPGMVSTLIVVFGIAMAVYAWNPDSAKKLIGAIWVLFGPVVLVIVAVSMLPLVPTFVVATALAVGLGVWAVSTFVIWGHYGWLAFVPYVAAYVVLTFFLYPSIFAPDTRVYEVFEGQAERWSAVGEGVTSGWEAVTMGVEREYHYAIGDYERGVEEASQKPLGVFLEDIGTTSKFIYRDDVVDVFATLRAESFRLAEDELLNVNVRCYVQGDEDVPTEIRPAGSKEFTLAEYELRDLDCLIDAEKLGLGINTVVLEATFDFVTSAYLKSYFMEQERIRSFMRQGLNPLAEFDIADQDPVAVHTRGPIGIGIGVGRQPVPLVEGETPPGPTLGITFENLWRGKINEFKKLKIILPPGMGLQSLEGRKGIECGKNQLGESECVFSEETGNRETLKDLTEGRLDDRIIHLRGFTQVEDRGELMQAAPLAVRSFKVEAKYEYKIEKKIEVTVREPRAEEE